MRKTKKSPGRNLLEKGRTLRASGSRPLNKRPIMKIALIAAVVATATAPSLQALSAIQNTAQHASLDTHQTTTYNVAPGTPFKLNMKDLAQPIYVDFLGTITSKQDQDKTDFLKTVGGFLQDFSTRTGFEACGFIWFNKTTGQYTVPLTTTNSHSRCANTNMQPNNTGFVSTFETIHVHPEQLTYRLNAADQALNPSLRNTPRKTIIRSGDGSRFSKEDFNSGPGYVVTGGLLLYQQGEGTSIAMGNVTTHIDSASLAKNEETQPLPIEMPVDGRVAIQRSMSP